MLGVELGNRLCAAIANDVRIVDHPPQLGSSAEQVHGARIVGRQQQIDRVAETVKHAHQRRDPADVADAERRRYQRGPPIAGGAGI